jgi:DNA-binding transcriptional LysR family regulator
MEVIFSSDQNYNHWYDGSDHESEIDLHICEEDEPAMSRSWLELARALCASNRTCWILALFAMRSDQYGPLQTGRMLPLTPMPIPRKNLYAVKAANNPDALPPAP